MKKLFIISIFIFALSLAFTSISSAAKKDGGQNQAMGCFTRSKDYHYTLSDSKYKGKVVFGRITIGVCANEHYSPFYGNYVAQADVYISETGAYAPCSAWLYLQQVDKKSIFGDSNVDKVYFDCLPTHTNFHWHFQGQTVQRVDQNPNKTTGQRYYGNINVSYFYPGNSQEDNGIGSHMIDQINFNGPSVTMK